MEFNECLANLFSRGNFKPLLLGNFNFHVDDLVNLHANRFLNTLTLFGLSQHVHVPTHSAGHTRHDLDVYNIKTEASIVSDHHAVLFDLASPPPVPLQSTVHYCKWHHVDIPAFDTNLQLCFQEFPFSLDDAVSVYNSPIAAVADKHALVKSRSVTIRTDCPWYTEELAQEKSLCRRLERQAHKSGLQVDHDGFVDQRNLYNFFAISG
jgi:hypothetical protein